MLQVPLLHEEASEKEKANLRFTDFVYHSKRKLKEIYEFDREINRHEHAGRYGYETYRQGAQESSVLIRRQNNENLNVVNMATYNYLAYGTDKAVINASKAAIDRYGIGACCSPILGGQLEIHRELEESLQQFFAVPGWGVSLFSSGYGANVGLITAIMKPGTHVIMDQFCHMSMIEGARMAKAKCHFFEHNNMAHLEQILISLKDSDKRVLICTEGVFSTEGDFGQIAHIVSLAKQYNALTLVDEAHSMLLCGEKGRGACDMQNVLEHIDFLVLTFSKSFSAIGGAVLAKKERVRYLNYYARCRMFSCALGPAVCAGIIEVLKQVTTADGAKRRERLEHNIHLLHKHLAGQVKLFPSKTWIVPIVFGDERISFQILDFLQRSGLDVGLLVNPAVPKGEARIRLFVASHHSEEEIKKAANIIIDASRKFGFNVNERHKLS